MNDVRAAYIAGLMDGEGSIMLISQRVGEYKQPVISITTTTPELLEGLVEEFNGIIRRRDIKSLYFSNISAIMYIKNSILDFFSKICYNIYRKLKRIDEYFREKTLYLTIFKKYVIIFIES